MAWSMEARKIILIAIAGATTLLLGVCVRFGHGFAAGYKTGYLLGKKLGGKKRVLQHAIEILHTRLSKTTTG